MKTFTLTDDDGKPILCFDVFETVDEIEIRPPSEDELDEDEDEPDEDEGYDWQDGD